MSHLDLRILPAVQYFETILSNFFTKNGFVENETDD